MSDSRTPRRVDLSQEEAADIIGLCCSKRGQVACLDVALKATRHDIAFRSQCGCVHKAKPVPIV